LKPYRGLESVQIKMYFNKLLL